MYWRSGGLCRVGGLHNFPPQCTSSPTHLICNPIPNSQSPTVLACLIYLCTPASSNCKGLHQKPMLKPCLSTLFTAYCLSSDSKENTGLSTQWGSSMQSIPNPQISCEFKPWTCRVPMLHAGTWDGRKKTDVAKQPINLRLSQEKYFKAEQYGHHYHRHSVFCNVNA